MVSKSEIPSASSPSGYINVQALPGRVVKSAPSGGKVIPSTSPMLVPDSKWIRRLIDVHGDLVIISPNSTNT